MTSSLPSCSGLSHTKNVVECVSLSTTMRFPSASGRESKYTQGRPSDTTLSSPGSVPTMKPWTGSLLHTFL